MGKLFKGTGNSIRRKEIGTATAVNTIMHHLPILG
jgi:hypothetical protein